MSSLSHVIIIVEVKHMKTVKILHCADLHLDASFVDLSDQKSRLRREEIKINFSEIIDMANRNHVELLIICGDIFDKETVSKQTVDYFVSKLNELNNTNVALIAGNHDSINNNYYYKQIDWPKHVHFFREEASMYVIEELGVTVYGASFLNPYQETNQLSGFTVQDHNHINIVLMHGELVSRDGRSQYNPITEDLLKHTEADYIALGHMHTYNGIKNIDSVHWAYSGTPLGKGFDECGDKGIVMGTVGKKYCQLDFVPIAGRQYHEVEIDVEDMTLYDEIINAIEKEMNDKDLYKIILVGNRHELLLINSSQISNYFQGKVFFVKIVDETKLKIDYKQIAKDHSLKGAFVSEMYDGMQAASKNEEELIRRAMDIGIKALNGEGFDIDDN